MSKFIVMQFLNIGIIALPLIAKENRNNTLYDVFQAVKNQNISIPTITDVDGIEIIKHIDTPLRGMANNFGCDKEKNITLEVIRYYLIYKIPVPKKRIFITTDKKVNFIDWICNDLKKLKTILLDEDSRKIITNMYSILKKDITKILKKLYKQPVDDYNVDDVKKLREYTRNVINLLDLLKNAASIKTEKAY